MLYTCIFLRRSDVIQADRFEADDDGHAIRHAMGLCKTIGGCTGFELWLHAHKVHHYDRPMAD